MPPTSAYNCLKVPIRLPCNKQPTSWAPCKARHTRLASVGLHLAHPAPLRVKEVDEASTVRDGHTARVFWGGTKRRGVIVTRWRLLCDKHFAHVHLSVKIDSGNPAM